MSSSASVVSAPTDLLSDESASETIGCAPGSNFCTIGAFDVRRQIAADRLDLGADVLRRDVDVAPEVELDDDGDTPSSEMDVMRSTPSTGLNASSIRRVTSRSIVSELAPS